MKNYRFLFIGVLIVLLTNACRKELMQVFSDKTAVKAEVQWAQDYYNQQLKPKEHMFMNLQSQKLMTVGTIKKDPAKKILLNWESVDLGHTPEFDFVEIPLKSNFVNKSAFVLSKGSANAPQADEKMFGVSFDRLIIYKDKRGNVNQRILSYIPDKAYAEKHAFDISHNWINKLDADFSGYLKYKDWEGNTLFILRIENGKSIRKLTPNVVPIRNKTAGIPNELKSMNMANPNCVVLTEYTFEQLCSWEYAGTGDFQMYCTDWYMVGEDEYTICEDGGGGDNGGNIDCSNPVNFEDAACEQSSEVFNDLTDPCKIAAFNAITSVEISNFIAGYYNNFLLPKSQNLKVTFKEQNDLSKGNNYVPAIGLDKSPINSSTVTDWEIVLSSNYFQQNSNTNMSKEAWGIIIAHEIVHLFIAQNNLSLPEDQTQHITMFKSFVTPMKDLLEDSFGMSSNDALTLALTGMKDLWGYSDFNNTLYSSYGVTSLQVDLAYEKFTTGNGGTKCN